MLPCCSSVVWAVSSLSVANKDEGITPMGMLSGSVAPCYTGTCAVSPGLAFVHAFMVELCVRCIRSRTWVVGPFHVVV